MITPPRTQDTVDFAPDVPLLVPRPSELSGSETVRANVSHFVHDRPTSAPANPPLSNVTNANHTKSHEKERSGAKADSYIGSDRDGWRRPLAGLAPRRSQRLHSRGPYFDRTYGAAAPHLRSSPSTHRSAAHLTLGRSCTPAARPPALFPFLRQIAADVCVDPFDTVPTTLLHIPSSFASPISLSCGLMQKTRVGVPAAILLPPIETLSGGGGGNEGSQSHGQIFTAHADAGEAWQSQHQRAGTGRGGEYGPDRTGASAGSAGTAPTSYTTFNSPHGQAWNYYSPQALGSSYRGHGDYRDKLQAERALTTPSHNQRSEDDGEEDELSPESEDDDEEDPDAEESTPWSETRDGAQNSSTTSALHQLYSPVDGVSGHRIPPPHPGASSSRAVGGGPPSFSAFTPGVVTSSRSGTKKRGNLPRSTTDLLKAWIHDHADHPYPTEGEKRQLCAQTGMDSVQMSNWMINVSLYISSSTT